LYVSNGTDVRAVRLDTGRQVFEARGARPAFDWSRLYSAWQSDGHTVVAQLDPRTGAIASTQTIEPGFVVRAVTRDGRTVALGPPPLRGPLYQPSPRQETTLVVVRDGGPAHLVAPGNLEPEEFSADGHTLFVLDFTPALAPVKYQVRALDLDTGMVSDVASPDKDLQQAMGATARTQSLSPDGSRLYTLYTLLNGPTNGHRRAFVHVLDLAGKWAHCVELPASFGNVAAAPAAMTVSADGRNIYVYDGESGRVADVDTVAIALRRTTATGLRTTTSAAATMRHDGAVIVAAGRHVAVLDSTSLRRQAIWAMRQNVVDLQSTNSDELFVASTNGVVIADPTTGAERSRIPLRDIAAISRIGSPSAQVTSPRQGFLCAC
jgi:hypothetical protein